MLALPVVQAAAGFLAILAVGTLAVWINDLVTGGPA